MQTYITTDELASRIHYDARTIRTRLKDVGADLKLTRRADLKLTRG